MPQRLAPAPVPSFIYTGAYEIVNDEDDPITTTSQDNWKIRFLTSGTLTFTKLNGAEAGIDVFLVGGGGSGANNGSVNDGGGGGGAGYTKTVNSIIPSINTQYDIVVGSGATSASRGESTSAFGNTANGGTSGANSENPTNGGSGGSGGGGGPYGSGGTDGNNGGSSDTGSGGTGQGTTTREFGESDGRLYSSGGSSGYIGSDSPAANTGNGGYGHPWNNNDSRTSGASGIVIIRNARS